MRDNRRTDQRAAKFAEANRFVDACALDVTLVVRVQDFDTGVNVLIEMANGQGRERGAGILNVLGQVPVRWNNGRMSRGSVRPVENFHIGRVTADDVDIGIDNVNVFRVFVNDDDFAARVTFPANELLYQRCGRVMPAAKNNVIAGTDASAALAGHGSGHQQRRQIAGQQREKPEAEEQANHRQDKTDGGFGLVGIEAAEQKHSNVANGFGQSAIGPVAAVFAETHLPLIEKERRENCRADNDQPRAKRRALDQAPEGVLRAPPDPAQANLYGGELAIGWRCVVRHDVRELPSATNWNS